MIIIHKGEIKYNHKRKSDSEKELLGVPYNYI